jgi:hypothetical protein
MDDAIVRECATRWDRTTTTTTTTIQKMRAETCERARWGFWEDRRFRTRHREDSARGTRDGRHVGRKSTTFEAIGGADDRVEAEGTTMEVNPFEVDERELEARASEPMGVGLEATPKVKETREDVALGNGDDDSNGTMGASGGGAWKMDVITRAMG